MAYEEEIIIAQQMFEIDRKSAKEISVQTGVPIQTVYRWIKDKGWKQSVVDRTLNKYEQLHNLRELVDQQFRELASSSNPDKQKLDLLRGYQRALAEFEKEVDMRGTIKQGVEVLVRYLRDKYPDVVKTLAEPLTEFPSWVNKEYPMK
jgi:hypothetical protein